MANTDDFPLAPDYVLPEKISEGVLRSQSIGRSSFQRIIAPPQRIFPLVFNARPTSDKIALQQFYREMEAGWFTFTHPAYLVVAGSYVNRIFPVRFNAAPAFELIGYEQWNIDVELIEAVGCALETADYPNPTAGHPTATIPGTVSGSDEIFIYAGYGFTYTGTGTLTLDGSAVTSPKYDVPLGLHRLYVTGGSGTLEAVI